MRTTVSCTLLAFSLTSGIIASGAPASTVPVLRDALRHDDVAGVTTALDRGADVNEPDDTGAMPLMYAALYAREASVRLLLDRGARVNVSNRFGATALMWSAARTPIVRLLIERGADVDAKASDGTTALVAAARFNNVDAMRVMVDAGADVTSPLTRTNLLTAAYLAWTPEVRDYLRSQHVVLTGAKDVKGPVLSRNREDPSTLQELLLAGVDPREEVPMITFTLPTFFLAAREGQLEAVRLLQKAGFDPKVKAARGWTAVMLAAGGDMPSIPLIQHLLDAGVDVTATDDDGRTALDWALTRGETPVTEFLRRAGATTAAVPLPVAGRSVAPLPAKDAVTQALARVQPAGPAFSDRTRCNSCHNQNIPGIAVTAARRRGVVIDPTLASHSFQVTQQSWERRRETVLLGDTNGGGFQANVQYGLLDLAESGAEGTLASDAMVLGLAARQGPDGSWPVNPDIRPPLTPTAIVGTALTIRGILAYAPASRRAEMQARVSRAADFLRRSVPRDTQDQAFKLLGLVWGGGLTNEVSRELAALTALQRADGGWGQWPTMASDAYATGLAMYALHAAGMDGAAPVYLKGVDYLLKTQLDDGSWFVRTRAFGFQPYFETGFPHGRSQFISTAATSWAATALSYAMK